MSDDPQDVFTMTPEQATAKLAEMSAALRPPPSANPKTPEEARLLLETRAQNK